MRVHFAEALEAGYVHLDVGVVGAKLRAYLIALLVGIRHSLLLSARELVKRRHRRVNIAVFDKRAHIAEEEGQKKRPYMTAVNIGIGHDDYLVIAELVHVELVPYPRAQRENERVELVVAVYLVGARLLHVQHFAPHGQYRLEAAVAPLNGGACGGVALDDVYLAQRGVALIAVLKLVGHLPALKPRLAPDGLLCLPCGLARAVCHHGLFKYDLRRGGVLLKILGELVVDDSVHQRADIRVAELLLRLPLELRLRKLDGYYGGDTLAHILAGDLVVALYYIGLHAVCVYDPCQRRLEARFVHAALGRVYVVCKAHKRLAVAVVILQRHLCHGVALGAAEIDDVLMYGVFVVVEVGHKFAYAALIAKLLALLHPLALIPEDDGEARVQKRLLAHTRVQYLIIVHRVVEHLRVGLEADGGAAALRVAEDLYMLHYIAAGELHAVALPVLAHLDLKPLRKRIHDRRADAVQAAGDLISPAAEFAARVQHREHDLQRGFAGLLLYVNRYAAAVILHADDVALLYRHVYVRAEAGKRLVDGVIHDLINKVVQSRGRGRADVHARALAHGLQPLKDLYL